jgi:hypothetical protein
MDGDDADIERAVLEGGLFQHLHYWPDRVVLAQVMVQPQLVQAQISISTEEFNASRARTGYLRVAPIDERPEVVNVRPSTRPLTMACPTR